MFKKTLLAASLAAMTTGAMAVDVATSAANTFGAEALANGFAKNDFTALTLNNVVLTLGAAYSVGDVIKVNLTGGTFKTTDTFALATSDASVIEAGFLSATANQLVFRVTTAAAGTATETLTLATGTAVKLDSIAAGSKVTVSAAAETSTGIAIDVTGTTDSKVVGTVIQQHKFAIATASTDLLSEKIDVADERKALTAATDTALITYTEVVPTFGATDFDVSGAGELTWTLNGSHTGFETGVTGATNLGAITIDGVAATVAADLESSTAASLATVTSDTMPVVFTPDTGATTRVVLNSGAYTIDAKITDGTYITTYSDIALGSFVLNGASENFGYVPVNYSGAVTTQFEIGNKGTVDGEITLTAFDTAGNDYDAILPFKAEAGKLTRISDGDISSAFGLTAGTKLKLTITVNSPAANISMAGYSNRGTTGRMAVSATTN